MLRSTLAQAGYSVIIASNGYEGIKKASEEPPGLILLDIMMPDMDGGDVAAILKNDPTAKGIPIIFLSSLVTGKENKTNSRKACWRNINLRRMEAGPKPWLIE